MKASGNKSKYSAAVTVLMFAFLLIGVILLATVCATAYKSVLQKKEATENLRCTVSYVRTRIKAESGGADVKTEEDGHVLVMTEYAGESCYELKIWAEKGKLYEQYGLKGMPALADAAVKITDAREFTAQFLSPSLIKITIDGYSGLVSLPAAEAEDGV